MRKMNQKLAIMLALLLATGILAGCSSNSDTGTGNAAETANTTSETVTTANTTSETATTANTISETATTGSTSSAIDSAAGETAASVSAALSPEMDNLEKTLAKIADDGNTWGIYVKNLTTGEEIGVNSEGQVLSASFIKLFIAGAYYQALDEGKFEDDYQQELGDMITYSDDTAANTLIDLIGMDYINDFIQSQGFSKGTVLNQRMAEAGDGNYVTAKDCGEVLDRIYEKTYVSSEASEQIWDYLQAQDSRNKIPAGILDEEAVIGNMAGEIGGSTEGSPVVGDVALVYGQNADIVICLIENGVYSEEIRDKISAMAGRIYDICNDTDFSSTGSTSDYSIWSFQ